MPKRERKSRDKFHVGQRVILDTPQRTGWGPTGLDLAGSCLVAKPVKPRRGQAERARP